MAFLSSGKRCSLHCRMASSFRWAARRAGFCKLKPQPLRIRPTWEGWHETPNSHSMTRPIRFLVHISPQNPKAAGPRPAIGPGSAWTALAGLRRRRAPAPSSFSPPHPLAHCPASDSFILSSPSGGESIKEIASNCNMPDASADSTHQLSLSPPFGDRSLCRGWADEWLFQHGAALPVYLPPVRQPPFLRVSIMRPMPGLKFLTSAPPDRLPAIVRQPVLVNYELAY